MDTMWSGEARPRNPRRKAPAQSIRVARVHWIPTRERIWRPRHIRQRVNTQELARGRVVVAMDY